MLNLRMALTTIYDYNNVHDRFLDKKAEKEIAWSQQNVYEFLRSWPDYIRFSLTPNYFNIYKTIRA